MRVKSIGRIGARLLTGAALVAACGATEPETQPPPSPETGIQLEPQLPTGVQLQASFAVPGMLDGQPTIQEEMRYLLYLPSGYGQTPDTLWPLILFLHGSGDDDYDSAFVLSYGLPAVLQAGEQPDEFPFIVVSPQASPGGTWWTEDALPVLDALLGEVLETYRVDPDRVYLTGLSMGGYGAWYLATTYPERFAAMISVSGSGYRTPFPPAEETLCRMEDLAVWAIHGAQDQMSDPEASRLNTLALKASCLGEVQWTLYEDEGHFGTFERAYRDPQLYLWLLEHHR
ncbi:MAG TPA: alpha/beta fold hydrolase [Anaerolineales bacterium]|nr:alpha/beta fold hydrolase [Anaerolineales bacterium]